MSSVSLIGIYIFHLVNEDNKKAGTIELGAETGHVEDYTY